MENTGRAQSALQCCTLHSLERNHIHLWSNIESNVQNKLKTQGFSSHFGTKVYNSCQYPTSKLQNTVSFGSPLSLPKMENIGCAQPALQCCTLHSLERNQRNFHTLSAKFKKTCVFVYFPGARSNRSNPTSYSFYLIGLLWSGDLRETSTAKHCLVWVSFVFAQNGKHWSCSTCLAMLHTAQFREGSLICGQTLSQKFKTSWKRKVFCTCWHKSAQFLSISQRNYHTLSAKLKKPVVFAYFPGARSNRSNPTSYSFYLIGLLWSGDLRETSKLQNTVSFGCRLSLPKMENTGRAQPALPCCTLHSLERDHTHLWSNIESKVQNELKTQGFLHILAQQCTILVNIPEKCSYFISKIQENPVFLYVFEGSFK